ncbi:hypothetical protein [Tateyamaria sp.]|uniref:hypothetical protein n=1 Tax=Tateyamaria sp. TaxID=1929288 RepID=UPI00329A99D5
MKNEVKLPYAAAEQFSLLLEALDAVHPFAARGGIETSYFNAYDEWENIVDALYQSFIVQPIIDTQVICNLQDFAKIGSHNQAGTRLLRFLVEIDGEKLLLHDIGLAADGHFKLLTFGSKDEGKVLLAISGTDLKNAQKVQLVSSKANAPDAFASFSF